MKNSNQTYAAFKGKLLMLGFGSIGYHAAPLAASDNDFILDGIQRHGGKTGGRGSSGRG